MTILQKTSRRGNVPATPTLAELLAYSQQVQRRLIGWAGADVELGAQATATLSFFEEMEGLARRRGWL